MTRIALLPSLLLVPAALLATACGDEDAPDTSTDALGLTAEEMTGDHPHCTRPHPELERVDANGDGAVTEAELTAFRAARRSALLAAFDTNQNGRLDRAERRTARAAFRAAYFAELDADTSGGLSPAEVEDRCILDRWFARIDDNADGTISEAEFLDARWPPAARRERIRRRIEQRIRRARGGS